MSKFPNDDKRLEKLLVKMDPTDFVKLREDFWSEGRVLRIHGVEITQGIQSYRASEHLSGIPGQRWDNTVRIVSSKTTWARVYVRNLFFPLFSNVGGTLKVYKRRFGFFWSEIAQISPESPGIVDAPLNADYATERGSLDHTLNFIIPSNLMCGNLRFDFEISSGSLKDSFSRRVTATLRQTLNMRILPVSYSGPDGSGNQTNLPAPSLANSQATAALCLALYPVQSNPNISLATGIQLNFPLTGAPSNPGGCAQSWLDLNALLSAAKVADGNISQTFYYGLVPSNVPIGVNSGCASSGVTSGRSGRQMTMAHEFGHGLGFGHSNCGNVGNSADSSIPVYEPYDAPNLSMASIGEYGLDIRNGNIMDPNMTRDYMSYCGPKWISLYNYDRSVQHGRFTPLWVCNDKPIGGFNRPVLDDSFVFTDDFPRPETPPNPPPWFDDYVKIAPLSREKMISLIAIRKTDGRFDLRSLTRVTAEPNIEDAIPTGLTVGLFNKDDKLMETTALMRHKSSGNCGCGGGHNDRDSGAYIVQAMLPDVGQGNDLRIIKGKKELWRIECPKKEPSVPKLKARETKDGKITIAWTTPKSDGSIEIWLQYRSSKKEEPKVLLIGSNHGSYEIEPGTLPPGEGVFQAINHNGFSIAASKPLMVNIPKGPPSIAILHPYHHQSLEYGRSMQLHGIASDCFGNSISPDYCYWLFNGEKVANGLDIFVPVPAPGIYKITLVVEEKSGQNSTESEIMVIDSRPKFKDD